MLKLVQTDNGVFDLAFDDPALGDTDAVVATIVYSALFTDAEAPVGRVSDPFDRRGWWADPAIGSGLWYVRRQALSPAARKEAIDMVVTALTAHRLTAVIAVENATSNPASVVLTIRGQHQGRSFSLDIPL